MKKWYESKTVLFNLLGLIVVVLQYLGSIKALEPHLVETILIGVNMVLRITSTAQPVEKTLL